MRAQCLSTGLCNRRGSKTLEMAHPEKPTPSGFRAKNYKMRLGWNVLMLLNPKFQVDWSTTSWDIHHWMAAAILDLFWFCILYSSFFLQISLEVAQWAALVCHNQPIWYSFTNRANSMCRHCMPKVTSFLHSPMISTFYDRFFGFGRGCNNHVLRDHPFST